VAAASPGCLSIVAAIHPRLESVAIQMQSWLLRRRIPGWGPGDPPRRPLSLGASASFFPLGLSGASS
jgi:hypothetical protein